MYLYDYIYNIYHKGFVNMLHFLKLCICKHQSVHVVYVSDSPKLFFKHFVPIPNTNEIRLVYVTCNLPSDQWHSCLYLTFILSMFHIFNYYIYYQINKQKEVRHHYQA